MEGALGVACGQKNPASMMQNCQLLRETTQGELLSARFAVHIDSGDSKMLAENRSRAFHAPAHCDRNLSTYGRAGPPSCGTPEGPLVQNLYR